jgi:hypothetical protein
MGCLLKRWWFWAGTGFILVAIVAGSLLIPIGEGRISQANCDRIQMKMKLDDVSILLGDAPQPVYDMDVDGQSLTFYWTDIEENKIVATFDSGILDLTAQRFVPSGLSPFERMKRRVKHRIQALWP